MPLRSHLRPALRFGLVGLLFMQTALVAAAAEPTPERGRDGKTVTGHTQRFGSGTITRWSDGTTTETRPFGSGTITTERGRDGKSVTGHTQKFGSGTTTTRSDGSRSTTQPFGSGTLQRDTPGRTGKR